MEQGNDVIEDGAST